MILPRTAEPSARILARLIDFAAWSVFWVFNGTIVSGLSRTFTGLEPWRLLVSTALTLVCVGVYELLFSGNGSATLGKRWLQIHVKTVEGQVPNLTVACIRTMPMLLLGGLVLIPSVQPFALLTLGGLTISGSVLIVVDPQRRTVWDRLAKTHVVNN